MRYIGSGSFLPGIPARDLNDEEVAKHGKKLLLDTGLYAERVKPRKSKVIEVVQEMEVSKWQA